jgi:hypothetical protein
MRNAAEINRIYTLSAMVLLHTFLDAQQKVTISESTTFYTGVGYTINYYESNLGLVGGNPAFRSGFKAFSHLSWEAGVEHQENKFFMRVGIRGVTLGSLVFVDWLHEGYKVGAFASTSRTSYVIPFAYGIVLNSARLSARAYMGADWFLNTAWNSYSGGSIGFGSRKLSGAQPMRFRIESGSVRKTAVLPTIGVQLAYVLQVSQRLGLTLSYRSSFTLGTRELYRSTYYISDDTGTKIYFIKNKGTYLYQELAVGFRLARTQGKRPATAGV